MAASGVYSRQLPLTPLLGECGSIVGAIHDCGNDLFSSWVEFWAANII